jgi:hypothetical protein
MSKNAALARNGSCRFFPEPFDQQTGRAPRVGPVEEEMPMKFLCYTLGDDSTLSPHPPDPELRGEMDRFIRESIEAGILVATGGLEPSAKGTKVNFSNNRFTVTDGPFAETKDLIGGWALIDVPTREQAVEQSKKFLRLVGGGEVTIRQVFGPDDANPDMKE